VNGWAMSKISTVWSTTWLKLDGWTTWVLLSRARNSFLSRSLTALSLSALAIANLPQLIGPVDLFSLRLVLSGSLLFLLGYLFFVLCAPAEFAQSGEIHEHVRRMRDLADHDFVLSRIELSARLLDRMHRRTNLRAPEGLLKLLSEKINDIKDNKGFEHEIPVGLFHADLALRQHDSPVLRLITAATLMIGAACLAFPTARNVLRALFPV